MRRFIFSFAMVFSSVYGRGHIDSFVTGPEAPWFTGSLIAPSATIVPKGHFSTEPYFTATAFPDRLDNDWKAQKQPTSWLIGSSVITWFGLNEWADLVITPSLYWKHRNQAAHWVLGDSLVQINFQLYPLKMLAKTWIPAIKFGLREYIPLGKYRNLDPLKLSTDSFGSGSWTTALQLVFGKLFPISDVHYINAKLAFFYFIPTLVHVKGFNVYGGGFGTNGTVSPGNLANVTLGLEYSLTRNWVLAVDLVGNYHEKYTFSGKAGVTASGFPASNAGLASIQYSIAPAIEYNWSENLGVIAGVWFSVAGKNIQEFYSSQIAISYFK